MPSLGKLGGFLQGLAGGIQQSEPCFHTQIIASVIFSVTSASLFGHQKGKHCIYHSFINMIADVPDLDELPIGLGNAVQTVGDAGQDLTLVCGG